MGVEEALQEAEALECMYPEEVGVVALAKVRRVDVDQHLAHVRQLVEDAPAHDFRDLVGARGRAVGLDLHPEVHEGVAAHAPRAHLGFVHRHHLLTGG